MRYNNIGNNSWLYQKVYYKGFDWDRKENENYAPGFFAERLNWLKSAGLVVLNNKVAESIIKLKTIYPGLATGVGVTHESKSKGELKLGFEFDYTSGMPVIRGHGLKGALRAAFPQAHNKDVGFKAEKAYQIYCWLNNISEFTKEGLDEFMRSKKLYDEILAYENEIFNGTINGKLVSSYKQDVFFDSFISKASTHPKTAEQCLGTDSITPHIKRGLSYEASMLKNPVPIPFLKILPGIEIEFRFKLNNNGLLSKEQKIQLFTRILLDSGIGAKTNVGYGQLVPV